MKPRVSPMLTLTAPIPPSLNNAYTNGRGHGRRVLTKEGRDYKEYVASSLLGTQPLPDGARIGLAIQLWFPTKRRRDISNWVKLLEDALSEALGFDDCAVDRLLVERVGYDATRPRCEVTIEVLG
jgi:Holliday junction resolvase RusA-like endonuclease